MNTIPILSRIPVFDGKFGSCISKRMEQLEKSGKKVDTNILSAKVAMSEKVLLKIINCSMPPPRELVVICVISEELGLDKNEMIKLAAKDWGKYINPKPPEWIWKVVKKKVKEKSAGGCAGNVVSFDQINVAKRYVEFLKLRDSCKRIYYFPNKSFIRLLLVYDNNINVEPDCRAIGHLRFNPPAGVGHSLQLEIANIGEDQIGKLQLPYGWGELTNGILL